MSPPQSPKSDRAVLYARISEDLQEGAGVERQLKDARALAEARGWTVVAECHDNDISALRRAHRPGYQEVVELVAAGKVDRVVAWQTSRLFRNRIERAQAIEDFARAKVIINAVKGPEFDLTTAYGRGQFGLLGEFDTMESEVKSERVLAANMDRLAKGLPSGDLGYGWRKVTKGEYEIVEGEAAIVREITDRLLAGETLRALTADLNERGVPAPKTATWGKTSVKKLAMRHSNVALRLHHRGQEDEQIVPGVWPPLVDRAKWERVVALLSAPDRRKNGVAMTGKVARPGAREHLLSWGIGTCGAPAPTDDDPDAICGGMLRAVHRKTTKYGVPRRYYQCEPKACVSRDEAAVDDLIAELVIGRLSKPDALSWAMPDESEEREAAERVEALQREVEETEAMIYSGEMPKASGARLLARYEADLAEAEERFRRLAVRGSRDVLAAAAGPKAREWWEAESRSVAQKRAVVEALLAKVIILPTTRGPGFKPEHIDVEWRRVSV